MDHLHVVHQPPSSSFHTFESIPAVSDVSLSWNLFWTLTRRRRAAASTRVLEYYSSSSKLLEYFFATRVLVNFYFLLQIPIFRCIFCSQLTNCWNLCELRASSFHLQHASLEIDQNIAHPGPRYADPPVHHPAFFVIGSLF